MLAAGIDQARIRDGTRKQRVLLALPNADIGHTA
jgi:hypothetical protein